MRNDRESSNPEEPPNRHRHRIVWLVAVLVAIALFATGGWYWHMRVSTRPAANSTASTSSTQPSNTPPSEGNSDQGSPSDTPGEQTTEPSQSSSPPVDMSPQAQAQRAVDKMSLDEQVGQLVMTPLYAGTDPATLRGRIADDHLGSVLMIGNWTNGTAGVKQATDTLQSFAPEANKLIIGTDQEGGQVQHLKGPGFSRMPSAVRQGRMTQEQLRQSAAVWGAQLNQAGVNVDLAPVVDTVQTARSRNAAIGALYRDFGGDGPFNAAHASAFVEGMRQAGVQSAIKHYPGLGAIRGNTDFTASGVNDTTTTFEGEEMGAFTAALKSQPGMVMMSLATYEKLDPNSPAALSSAIIDGHLRKVAGFQGVVTSDSLSATALSGIKPEDLGVRFVEAGGDLACVGVNSYVEPILQGLRSRAHSDAGFAQKVTQAATRVMTLKYQMGLAH